MAEERLIDDDKDRKYKIRKNADGEDELYIDDSDDGEDEEVIFPVFEVPEQIEDDEDAAVLTPEQYAERERIKAEEQAVRQKKADELVLSATANLEKREYEAAAYDLSRAEEYAKNGEIYCKKLRAVTHDFTDFSSPDKCAEAADGIEEYADESQKAELKKLAGGLKQRIDEMQQKAAQLSERNEQGKAERRELFAAERKRALIFLLSTAIPFAALAVLSIVFACNMFAAENGAFLIATIVCGAITAIALGFTLVTLRIFLTANRRLNFNEKDSSTKLGREYAQISAELAILTRVYSSFDL